MLFGAVCDVQIPELFVNRDNCPECALPDGRNDANPIKYKCLLLWRWLLLRGRLAAWQSGPEAIMRG